MFKCTKALLLWDIYTTHLSITCRCVRIITHSEYISFPIEFYFCIWVCRRQLLLISINNNLFGSKMFHYLYWLGIKMNVILRSLMLSWKQYLIWLDSSREELQMKTQQLWGWTSSASSSIIPLDHRDVSLSGADRLSEESRPCGSVD